MIEVDFEPMDRPETLTDRVYRRLKRALMSGAFRPGQKITNRSIANGLSVSLTPAREAIGRLVAEGALDFGPNRTVFAPMLTPERLAELYRLRILLEGILAEEAGKRLDPSAADGFEEIQLRLIAALDRKDYQATLSENEAFHFGIYRAARLPLTLQIVEGLWLQMGPSLNLLYPEYGRSRTGVSHHMEAIQAIRSGDSSALRLAIERDLADGQQLLSSSLKQAIDT